MQPSKEARSTQADMQLGGACMQPSLHDPDLAFLEDLDFPSLHDSSWLSSLPPFSPPPPPLHYPSTSLSSSFPPLLSRYTLSPPLPYSTTSTLLSSPTHHYSPSPSSSHHHSPPPLPPHLHHLDLSLSSSSLPTRPPPLILPPHSAHLHSSHLHHDQSLPISPFFPSPSYPSCPSDNAQVSSIGHQGSSTGCTTSGKQAKDSRNSIPFNFKASSKVEALYDGYRWRKYGKRATKGSPHPRYYYKCFSISCNARKQVQMSPQNDEIVFTTYEGTHNHEPPPPIALGILMKATPP